MKRMLLALALALSAFAAGCATPLEMTRDDLYSLKGDGSAATFGVDPDGALAIAGDIFRGAGLTGVQHAEGESLVTAYGHKGGAFGTYAAAWSDPVPGGSLVTVVTKGKVNMGLWSSIKLLDESTFLEEFGKRAPRLDE